jgi:Ca-activated chloride channel family protein
MPPVDAVRIEEMINYFSYDYQSPSSDQPFAVHHEMAVCPWNQEHYLMKVGLKGKEIAKDNLPASNLVFLIDVSGSMSPANKLPLLKSAFSLLVDELRPQDRVSMVVYAGASGCVLDPTPGNQKRTILEALNRLEAGGSTAGGAGLKLAYEKAAASFIEGGNNRIILASDGDFNVGVSSNAEMERLVTANRDKGIFMTVLGFGMGNYKDDRLEIIANKGNGNYAYIDNLQEARKTLIEEFGGTLFTIAKDVKFQIEFNPSRVLAYRLIGYENRLLNAEDFNDDKKDAGEIGAGHTVTALYEIIPVGAADAATWVKQIDPLKYQSMEKADETNGATKSIVDEWLTLKLRYKQPDGNKSTLLEIPVKGKVKSFDNASDDFRFAASVAGFGMLLRQSEFKGDLSYPQVREMAMAARGDDADGFKGEMVRLVKTAETLSRQLAVAE